MGMCAHGLAIARALHFEGIKVYGLEADTSLPGISTRAADIHYIKDINGPRLVDSLLELRPSFGPSGPPVLFLTNDRMIETTAASIAQLKEHYRLSWSGAADKVLTLLRKENLARRCEAVGLRYPRSMVINDTACLESETKSLRYPLIVKPCRPLSNIKAVVVHSVGELAGIAKKVDSCLPVLVQEYIPGGDEVIRFGALYLREGEVLARFEGRKLRSRPMGHTTVAISERSEEIHELACKFFDGLGLSGPVSLELKQGPDGTQWVIEPTVGRTDFWVGLAIRNGVNLPLVEYTEASDGRGAQVRRYIWINGERDPIAPLWVLWRFPNVLWKSRLSGVYADTRDMRPFWAQVRRLIGAAPRLVLRKWRSASRSCGSLLPR